VNSHLTRTRKSALTLTGAALAALALTSCGSSSRTSHTATGAGATATPTSTSSFGPAASGPHNAQDATFLTDMIPHHTQAVEMAEMALSRGSDADVKALATQIKAAQGPEISQMSGWLIGWGKTIPAGSGTGHDMSGMEASDGMMSTDEMTMLDHATSTEFAKLFLTGMTKHHEGAVTMAQAELSMGQNTEVKTLASKIIAAQDKEITTMKALLTRLGG
jgi:uncharacterized protein (DUF305 family)